MFHEETQLVAKIDLSFVIPHAQLWKKECLFSATFACTIIDVDRSLLHSLVEFPVESSSAIDLDKNGYHFHAAKQTSTPWCKDCDA